MMNAIQLEITYEQLKMLLDTNTLLVSQWLKDHVHYDTDLTDRDKEVLHHAASLLKELWEMADGQ